MRGRAPKAVDVSTAPYPAFPDRHAGAVHGAERGRRRRRHDHRERVREPLHACAGTARAWAPTIRLEGNTAMIRGVDRARRRAGDGDRPARFSVPGARRPGRRRRDDGRAHLPHRPRLRVHRGEARQLGAKFGGCRPDRSVRCRVRGTSASRTGEDCRPNVRHNLAVYKLNVWIQRAVCAG